MPNLTNPLIRLVCSCGQFRSKGTIYTVMADFERHILEQHAQESEANLAEEEQGSENAESNGS